MWKGGPPLVGIDGARKRKFATFQKILGNFLDDPVRKTQRRDLARYPRTNFRDTKEKARRIGEIRRASLLRLGDAGPAQGVEAGSEEGRSVTRTNRAPARPKVSGNFVRGQINFVVWPKLLSRGNLFREIQREFFRAWTRSPP